MDRQREITVFVQLLDKQDINQVDTDRAKFKSQRAIGVTDKLAEPAEIVPAKGITKRLAELHP